MPTIAYLPTIVPLSSSGALMAGAKLYTYVTATSTPKAAYTDFALTTPHANPIVADANGVFPAIYLATDARYRFTLKTSLDVTVNGYPLDDIAGPGEVTYIRTAAEIAASVTPTNYAYPQGDIRRYGAVCDGSTNDYTAVQNALNVGGLVTFPPNTSVKVNSALTMDAATTTLDGQGAALTTGLASGYLLTIGSSGGAEACARNAFRRLYIGGTAAAGLTAINITAASTIAGFTIDRVSIYNFETGTRLYSNAFCINFDGCMWSSCGNAVYVPGGGTSYGEKITFNHCFFSNNTTRALYATANACQFFLVNCSLDYNKTIIEVNQGRAYFDNCYAESNVDTAYWFITGTTESCHIRWHGGTIVITGAKTAYSLANAGSGSVVKFDSVDLYSASNSVGGNYLGTGAGATFANNCHITGFTNNALAWAGPSPSQNLCDNGAFTTNLNGWTVTQTGSASAPARNATAGSTGGPAMEFNASGVGTESRAVWTIPVAEAGEILGVTMGIKGENVAADITFVLQAYGGSGDLIASSDIINGQNNFGASNNFANTNWNTYRNTYSRLPAGTTSAKLVMVSDYSSAYKVWVENVVICKY